jgi:hypothetical protein
VKSLAAYIFENQGKLLRPKFSYLLAAKLTGEAGSEFEETMEKVKIWSAVIEMIHNSSLLQVWAGSLIRTTSSTTQTYGGTDRLATRSTATC